MRILHRSAVLVLVLFLVAACGDEEVTGPELDLTGSWTLVVAEVCSGTLSVTQQGTSLSTSGSIGGTYCPYSASGNGTGQLTGNSITFGVALGSANGESGQVEFTGTVAGDGNSMSGTFEGISSGPWSASRN